MTTPRYKVVEGSESAHCCFEYTVVDTETIEHELTSRIYYKAMCECFDKEEAETIAQALNQNSKEPK